MSNQGWEEEDYTKQLDWSLWGKIGRLALRQKRYIIPLAATAMTLAVVEAGFGLVTRRIVDDVTKHGAEARLTGPLVVYGALTLALVFCVWTFIVLAGRIATGMSFEVRRDAFAKLQQLSFSYYDKRPVGWLLTRVTSDCSKLSDIMAWGMLDLVWCVTFIIAMSSIMVWMHWQLALLTLTTLPVLALVSGYFKRVILQGSREVKKLNSRITASYNEGLMGVRTTKVLVREEEGLGEFKSLTADMSRAAIRTAVLSALYLPIVMTLGSIGTGFALWYGGSKVLGGALSLGTLVAFITYSRQFFDPIQQMAAIFTNLQSAQAAGERLISLLEEVPEIKDSPEVTKAIAEQAAKPARAGVAIDGQPDRITRIEFRNVGFAYGTGPKILDGFNLTVESGQTIALVGPTGGGKSTIVSLVCRFYEPTEGEVLIDGTDYRRRSLHWLQSNLGIVLQQPHLFNGTIRENIRYGRLDATDAEIEAAARKVNAHEFILKTEKGYDTPVGEGGNKLSIGQKQLVSFARAILANPRIFVMDEATSSVDTETERLIQHGLESMLKGRISFIIAHRLSTIRSADKILVIEKGRIAECGNHHELIQRRGHYYELYTNQFVREKEEAVLR